MFKHGLYQFIPPPSKANWLVAILWMLGVLLVSIGLYAAGLRADAATPLAPPGAIEAPFRAPGDAVVQRSWMIS